MMTRNLRRCQFGEGGTKTGNQKPPESKGVKNDLLRDDFKRRCLRRVCGMTYEGTIFKRWCLGRM